MRLPCRQDMRCMTPPRFVPCSKQWQAIDGRRKRSGERSWHRAWEVWMASTHSEVRGAADRRTHQQRSEVRDGMHIDWDVPITMDDGLVLRADIFRPVADGHYPVILSYGPYAKGLAFQDGYPSAWERMAT